MATKRQEIEAAVRAEFVGNVKFGMTLWAAARDYVTAERTVQLGKVERRDRAISDYLQKRAAKRKEKKAKKLVDKALRAATDAAEACGC